MDDTLHVEDVKTIFDKVGITELTFQTTNEFLACVPCHGQLCTQSISKQANSYWSSFSFSDLKLSQITTLPVMKPVSQDKTVTFPRTSCTCSKCKGFASKEIISPKTLQKSQHGLNTNKRCPSSTCHYNCSMKHVRSKSSQTHSVMKITKLRYPQL